MLRGSLWFIVAAESFRAALYAHFFRFLPPFFFALAAAFMPDFVYGYFLPLTIGIIYLLKKRTVSFGVLVLFSNGVPVASGRGRSKQLFAMNPFSPLAD